MPDPHWGISDKPRPISGKLWVFQPLLQHEAVSVCITIGILRANHKYYTSIHQLSTNVIVIHVKVH